MEKKYIVLDDISCIIFSPDISHDTFKGIGNITSAGFFKIDETGEICVYGYSHSLKLGSKNNDKVLIKILLRKERGY